MLTQVDEYKHLDEQGVPAALIESRGVKIELSTEELLIGLLKTNRGVHRLLSALTHRAKQALDRELKETHPCKDKYVREAKDKLDAITWAARIWI